MAKQRTDLAAEAHELWKEGGGEPSSLPGVTVRERRVMGFPVTEVVIDDPASGRALGKAPGRYVTVELSGLIRRERDCFRRGAEAVAALLGPMLPAGGTVLVAGLGNRAITPDRVGPLTAENLLVTRHLTEAVPGHFGHLRPVAAVTPGVLALTGVESAAAVKGLVDTLKPACVVAVDALASRSVERLCRTVQLTDTGIVPGSGVGNHRMGLTEDTLGVPVVGVGVPTVVEGATLAMDLLGKEVELPAGELFVTPREIDQRVADLSRVLARGISLGLDPALCWEELEALLG